MKKDLNGRRHQDEGFSLVELMVVILVIAILIAIGLPTFLGSRSRAQDRAAQSELRAGLAGGLTYFTKAGSWTGFDDLAAKEAEPTLEWLDGGDPPADEISIEIHFGSDLLMIRRSGSGTYFCLSQMAG